MQQQIVMIDDNALDHLIVKRICEREGLFQKMQHIENAQDLLDALKTDGNNITHVPDIILLDLQMPKVSGWDFLECLKLIYQQIGKKIDVHILSSSICMLDQERSMNYPFVKNYLVKPMTGGKLRQLHADYCN
ncbi:response regulator receiver domain-containing protein [Mucilaginibacter yixingensis]|uniref:Response regulator receiver domain-containing protein n=1 Tax=Mucilaginibacter yixingensis TaxID=1295612 RepID=A0A2T5JBD0_9SPHI|nr:response regulator [Mucilaginibacter yixingensis]PTQ98181.1 response regulator receiver domain-containing protein [Mucilaginibacter yixingensis]